MESAHFTSTLHLYPLLIIAKHLSLSLSDTLGVWCRPIMESAHFTSALVGFALLGTQARPLNLSDMNKFVL